MIVITKANAHLVSDGPLLNAADHQIRFFFDDIFGKLQGIGVIHDNGAVIADFLKFRVIFRIAGLGTGQHHIHAQKPQGLDE